MKTELSFAPLAGIETELLAVLAADTQTSNTPGEKPQPALLTADEAIQAAVAAVFASGEFKAGANETLLLHFPSGLASKRLLIVGVGKQAKATVNSVRAAAGTAVIFSGHDAAEAQRHASRLLILAAGRLVFDGTPVGLLARHPEAGPDLEQAMLEELGSLAGTTGGPR